MISKKKLIASVAILSAALLGVSQATVANAAGATGSIEVFSWWTSGSESAALNAIFAGLTKANPSIKIVNAAVAGGAGTNAKQVLATRLAAGDTPETWQSHPGGDLKGYVDQSVVMDLSSLYKSQGWDKVVPKNLMDSMTYSGKTYSVLTGIHRANTLWTNKALFKKARVTIGTNVTWAQFAAAATKLKAAGITPICLGDKDIWTAAMILEDLIVGELGAPAFNSLAAGKTSWADPKVAAVVGHFNQLLSWTNTDHKALDWTGAVAALANGTCAMNMMGDWAYGELLVKQGKKDGIDFGYSVIGDAKTFITVGDSFVVGTKSKNPAGAEAFVKAIMDPKVQIAFNKLKGSSPYRTDVNTSSLGAYQRAASKVLASGTLVASLVHGQQLVPAAVSQAFSDGVTVLEANKDAAAFGKSMTTAAKG
jgi:glucose/mannose transport system substrate-binding protein